MIFCINRDSICFGKSIFQYFPTSKWCSLIYATEGLSRMFALNYVLCVIKIAPWPSFKWPPLSFNPKEIRKCKESTTYNIQQIALAKLSLDTPSNALLPPRQGTTLYYNSREEGGKFSSFLYKENISLISKNICLPVTQFFG